MREPLAPGQAAAARTASNSSSTTRAAPSTAALRGGIGPRSPAEFVTQLTLCAARGRTTAMNVLSAGLGNRKLASIVAAGDRHAASNVGVLARETKTPSQRRALRPAELEELAQWPNDAHRRWKQLGTLEQGAVVERMSRRYGRPFADEFRGHAQNGTADPDDAQAFPTDMRSPDFFIQRGFRIAQQASYQVWLVHPAGRWRYLYGAVPITTHPPCDGKVVEAIKAWADECEQRQKTSEGQRDELRTTLQKTNRFDPDYQDLFEEYEAELTQLDSDVATYSTEANSFAMSNPNCAQYIGEINQAVDRMTEVGHWIETERMPWPAGWLEYLRPNQAEEKQIPDRIRKRVPGLPSP